MKKMKKMKKMVSLLTTMVVMSTTAITAFADNNYSQVVDELDDMSITTDAGLTYTVDDGGFFDDAILLSEETNNSNASYETVRTYRLSDGTICKDTLIVESNNKARSSSSGSANNITHTTDVGMATVSIISSFDWYTKGSWSYVRCSNMTAYYSTKTSQVVCGRFNKSKSNGYIKSGSAWAKVDYSFRNKNVPGSGKSGTFKVTCSDSGKVHA